MKTPQQLLQQTLEVGACLLPDAASGGRTPYPAVHPIKLQSKNLPSVPPKN